LEGTNHLISWRRYQFNVWNIESSRVKSCSIPRFRVTISLIPAIGARGESLIGESCHSKCRGRSRKDCAFSTCKSVLPEPHGGRRAKESYLGKWVCYDLLINPAQELFRFQFSFTDSSTSLLYILIRMLASILFGAAILYAVLIFLYRFVIEPVIISPLSKIPAAHPTSSFSSAWILWTRWCARENATVLAAHERLGPLIRLGPNEISVNCVDGGIRTVSDHVTLTCRVWV
jgi:hypothetical protein